jgi:hypothetical protein
MADKWIPKDLKKGALHRDLGVPEGEKIPAEKLAAAAAKGGKVGQRARFAETAKGFSHTKTVGHAAKKVAFKD